MAEVVVTGTIRQADNGFPTSGIVRFQLTNWDIGGTAVITEEPVEVALSATGTFSVTLRSTSDLEGTYNYAVLTRYYDPTKLSNVTERLGQIAVPSVGGPFVLADLLTIPTNTPDVPSVAAQAIAAQLALEGLLAEITGSAPTLISFGAACDGTTDDTEAFQDAVDYNGRVIIPAGRTVKLTDTIVIPTGLTEFSVTGQGPGATIRWAGDTTEDDLWDFRTNYEVTQLAKCTMRDFTVIGSHETLPTFIASYPMFVDCADDVLIENVEVTRSRVVGILVWRAKTVTIKNCKVHHNARGGIGAARCEQIRIENNDVHHNGDDQIFVPNWPYTSTRGTIITGNHLSYGNGIRCLGMQVGTISGNVLQHYTAFGVAITSDAYDGSTTVGLAATIAINISDNIFLDAVDREFLDDVGGDGTQAITFRANAATAGSLTYIPGRQATSPYAYYVDADVIAENLATTPIPVHGSVVIADNVMMRTLPKTGTYSSLGLDLFYFPDGEYDYDLEDDADIQGINLGGYLDNVSVTGNICQGVNVFLSLYPVEGMRNCRAAGNIVSDIRDACVEVNAVGTKVLDMVFDGNAFDMDPYHEHANRGATGGWLASARPEILTRDNAIGMTFRNNDFKNAARFGDTSIVTVIEAGEIAFEDNRFWGDPAATGFSTSNKGFGVIYRLTGQSLVHIECDPASADFDKIYRAGSGRSAAIPTTGTYIDGEFVAKTFITYASSATDRNVTALLGWDRISTGTGHVLNTDWAERIIRTNRLSNSAGYGGAVAQDTSKSTAVTLNAYSGQITTHAESLGAGASVEFEVNNSVITNSSWLVQAHVCSNVTSYTVAVVSASLGRFRLRLTNNSGGALAQSFIIGFEVRNYPIS